MDLADEPTPVSAALTLHLDDADDARLIERTLLPELGDEVPGTETRLDRDGSTLRLDVDAEDVPALRAAANAYLQWSETGLDIADVGARGTPGGNDDER